MHIGNTYIGRRVVRIGIALLAIGLGQFAVAQNLLINGNFENFSGTPAQMAQLQSQGYFSVPASGANGQPIFGWSSNNNPAPGNTSGVDVVTGPVFQPHNGNFGIDMVGTATGSTLGRLEQTVGGLSSGGFYNLSFNTGAFFTGDPNVPYLQVSMVSVTTGLAEFTATINAPPTGGVFTLQSFGFNLTTGGSYILRFDALAALPAGSDSGAYLDDVVLVVPEASTVWMAAIMIALVGHFGWKRFRAVRAVA